MAGIAVTAVALSLGGAFGLLSGRGVLAGMLSSAIFAFVTSLLGGTKVQCSGPTGPMTSVFIALIASASLQVDVAVLPLFLNMVVFLSAVLLLLMGLFRLGNLVHLVPNVVISGFMDGIALIIWVSQCKKLFQIGSPVIKGSMEVNIAVALATLVLAVVVTQASYRLPSKIVALVSGTLVSLIVMTVLCSVFALPIDRAAPDLSLHSFAELQQFAVSHSPTFWPWHLWQKALFWAVQLAGVAYLDTLLTSLIIDRRLGTTSKRNRELGAQGVATVLTAIVGGIPGAQATERSVLLVKEGARTRLAGITVGLCSLLGVLLLQDIVSLIPKAVFAGILLKVGYDVFDWRPFKSSGVSVLELSIIALTALLTLFMNVLIAVIVGTAVFMILGISDISQEIETEGLSDEP